MCTDYVIIIYSMNTVKYFGYISKKIFKSPYCSPQTLIYIHFYRFQILCGIPDVDVTRKWCHFFFLLTQTFRRLCSFTVL